MDSGNSGSLQSSSGGDEEFDSRGESMSAFLNSSSSSSNTSTHVGLMSSNQSILHHPPHHHQSTLFDPLSTYLDVFNHSAPPNSMLNLDMVWPRGALLRSEPNSNQPGGLSGLQSSTSTQPIITTQRPPGRTPFFDSSSKPSVETSYRVSGVEDQTNVPRNPKKRSRASRRAPTTVLTTDTSNFRAMVQEFTGIPAPPFSASPFPRTRLDLFTNASTMRTSFDPSPPPPPPSYILRPFAHKVQPPPFVSSTISPTISPTTTIAINTTATTPPISTKNVTSSACNSNSTTNYQQTLLNMQNQMPTFQSLLQSPPPPKYPSLSNVSIFGTKPQTLEPIPSTTTEDFGLSHGQHLGTLSNLVTTGGGLSLSSNENWCEGMGSNEGEHTHLRSFNGNYGSNNNSQRVSNSCKMNFSASTSEFHAAEKTSENVSTRGEGMVESWICSSD